MCSKCWNKLESWFTHIYQSCVRHNNENLTASRDQTSSEHDGRGQSQQCREQKVEGRGCLVSRGCLLANIMMVYVLLHVKGRSRGASLCDTLAEAADTFNNMRVETNPSCSRAVKAIKAPHPLNRHGPIHKKKKNASKAECYFWEKRCFFHEPQKKIFLAYILLHFVARQKYLRRQKECLIIMESIKAQLDWEKKSQNPPKPLYAK